MKKHRDDEPYEIERLDEAAESASAGDAAPAPPPGAPPPPEDTYDLERKPSGAPILGRWLWFFAPAGLFLIGFLSVALTQGSVGYAWDEAFYYEPARDAAHWAIDVVKGQNPLDSEKIDLAWEERHEHPSFHKFLSGFSLLAFEDRLGPIAAMRLPIAVLFGLTLALIFALGEMAWGWSAGLVAALAYGSLPRIFGHAHFSSLETPLLFSMLLTIYCFLRGLDSRSWAVACGMSLGLLLATKINGFFLIPPLILWGHFFARQRYVNNLFSMLVLGPIFFVLLWPWLWPDPVIRALEYLQFHATHQLTALFFMGRKWGYGDAAPPWYYPSVMIGVTVPLSIGALAVAGTFDTMSKFRARPTAVLYLLIGLTMWGVASAPSTPKYDGVRLLLPVFPMLALMAGAGGALVIEIVRRVGARSARPGQELKLARLALCGVALIVVIEGASASVRYYPHLLSYFNPLVGGAKGAEARGFEVTYWGEAVTPDVLETINRVVPADYAGPVPTLREVSHARGRNDLTAERRAELNAVIEAMESGARYQEAIVQHGSPELARDFGGEIQGRRVRLLALHEKCFEHLQRWGMLRRDIDFGGPPPYYAHLLLKRKGFYQRPESALAETTLFEPIADWSRWDVSLVTLYRTGTPFEQYWPRHPRPTAASAE